MRYAMAVMHLSIARHFPQIMSWVPRRRRAAGPHAANDGPDTLVLARSEPAFHAWLGLNIPAGERRRYAYLAAPEDLRGFRGRGRSCSPGPAPPGWPGRWPTRPS